jgi:hypothetical protein
MAKSINTPLPDRAEKRQTDAGEARRAHYGTLPARLTPDQLVEEAPTGAPSDPEMGRDANRDWMLRYS